MKTRRTFTAWLPCIVWMTVIFVMSAMPGDVSGEQSGRVVQILQAMFPMLEGREAQLQVLVRKGAHMAEYAVLFCLFFWALGVSDVHKRGAVALAMTVFYAATDEFHQMFTLGRCPSPADVMIDACGALIAWGILAAAAYVKKRRRQS